MPSYQTAPHLVLLADKLEQVSRGEIKRLIVTMPPRHGKSELVSLRFPCWYLALHPEDFIVQAGYAESIALTHSRRARDVFISAEMTRLFPDLHYRPERAAQEVIVPERQAAHEWGTKLGGSYYAVGIGGGLTGRGFNIGIIDDPIKDAQEAASQTMRDNIWEWYQTVFYTRMQPDARIIVVMTRWHHDDLVGRLLKLARNDPQSDRWEILHLPAIKDGKALWPERYPLDVLERIRAGQTDNPNEPGRGSRAFESLYQGNPSIAAGNIFKREWWHYYKAVPKFTRTIHSWDTAFKTKAQNDYSVCTVWGEHVTGLYLLDIYRQKVEFPELKRSAIALYGRDKPAVVLVEDKASGQSLIQELERNTRIPILPVKVDSDKTARAYAITPYIESGRVFLPESAPWLYEYMEELSSFPNGEHDDLVDSSTQAINWLNQRPVREEIRIYDSMRLLRGINL